MEPVYPNELIGQYLIYSVNCIIWFALALFFYYRHNANCPIRRLTAHLCTSLTWSNLVWLVTLLLLPFILRYYQCEGGLPIKNHYLAIIWCIAYIPMQIIALKILTFLYKVGCNNTQRSL